MLLQKYNLDDKMTIDNYTYGTTNTTAHDINKVNYEKKKKKKRIIIKQKHFLLCESCFWCASSIYINSSMNFICPVCNNNNTKVESIPIQSNEAYKFDYDQRLGVILEFSEMVV